MVFSIYAVIVLNHDVQFPVGSIPQVGGCELQNLWYTLI